MLNEEHTTSKSTIPVFLSTSKHAQNSQDLPSSYECFGVLAELSLQL